MTTLTTTPTASPTPADAAGPPDPADAPRRPQLRLVVAGSVDDGKSTLVGRLLHDTKSILADQFDAVSAASRRRGAQGVDLALLTDGLRAEREQGITIDVAYRYFSTPRRSFVLADTPGHVQYTRNTVTGASTAQAALVLVDARRGVLPQTRRHAAVLALLRIPHVVVAVNKMDTVDWDEARFDEVARQVTQLADEVGLGAIDVVPISALSGEHVVDEGHPQEGGPGVDPRARWYRGPSLLRLLETIDVDDDRSAAPLRMPVQLVVRPRTAAHPDYRGLAGRIASGSVSVGDAVRAWPSGLASTVTAIDTPAGPAPRAVAGQSVTVRLADDLDIGRGQVLAPGEDGAAPGGGAPAPRIVSELSGVVCWLSQRGGSAGSRVLLKAGTATVRALMLDVEAGWDVDAHRWVPGAGPLALNDIARVRLRLSEPVAVDDYRDDRGTGGFLLIDADSGATLAAGMVGDPLRAAGPDGES